MVQELLTNAIRHSGASAILVQCSQNKNNFYITVEDDGKGFNAEEAFRQGGMGLKNLRNRVEYLKGQMDIHAANGEGSTINIEFHVPA
jgi:signal transduction histidine kinase